MPPILESEALIVLIGATASAILTVLAVIQRKSESKRQNKHNLKPK